MKRTKVKQELYIGGEKVDLKDQSYNIIIYLKQLLKEMFKR